MYDRVLDMRTSGSSVGRPRRFGLLFIALMRGGKEIEIWRAGREGGPGAAVPTRTSTRAKREYRKIMVEARGCVRVGPDSRPLPIAKTKRFLPSARRARHWRDHWFISS